MPLATAMTFGGGRQRSCTPCSVSHPTRRILTSPPSRRRTRSTRAGACTGRRTPYPRQTRGHRARSRTASAECRSRRTVMTRTATSSRSLASTSRSWSNDGATLPTHSCPHTCGVSWSQCHDVRGRRHRAADRLAAVLAQAAGSHHRGGRGRRTHRSRLRGRLEQRAHITCRRVRAGGDTVKCKNECGDTVWWSAARSQWVHTGGGKALCVFPGLPVSTLRALPATDVHPVAVDLPAPPTMPEGIDVLTAPHPT